MSSVSLAEALRDVDLQPGQTYRCEVRGHQVELRVLTPSHVQDDAPSGFPDSDVMWEPWLELPEPACQSRGLSRRGAPLLPDVPLIPRDEESP